MQIPARRIPPILHVLMLALLFPASLRAREVTIAVFDSAPPVVFVDEEGLPAGVFPDMLRFILDEAGFDPVFVTGLSFAQAYDRVVAGEIDLLPGAVYTESRDQELDFHNQPVMVAWGQLGTRPGDDLTSVLELRGARVALMRDGQNGENFSATMESFDIPFEAVYFDSYERVSEAVLSEDVRAGVYFSSWFRNSSTVVPSSIIFAPTQAFAATAEGTNEDVLAAIDDQLRLLKQSESSFYYDVISRWLSGPQAAEVPRWVWISGAGITVALLLALVFTLVLRTRVRTATARLAESRERYRTVANYAHGWEFWIDPDGHFIYVSPNSRAVTGYDAAAFEQDPGLAARLVVEDDREIWQEIEAHGREPIPRERTQTLFRIRRADGKVCWIEHRGTSVFSDDGVFRGYRGTNIDVTDRVSQQRELEDSLRERGIMLKEIHHRVKNNLQVISSLLSLQQQSLGTREADELDAIAARIHAMAALHGVLYDEERFGQVDLYHYAESILRHIRVSLGRGRNITANVCAAAVRVGIDRALPIGLLMNETLTNAYKHAFNGSASGTITVVIAESGGAITVSIVDDGLGLPEPSPSASGRNGIGFSLIESLASQLNGTLTVDGSDGTTVQVVFPSE